MNSIEHNHIISFDLLLLLLLLLIMVKYRHRYFIKIPS